MSKVLSDKFEIIENNDVSRLILKGDVTIQNTPELKSALVKLDNSKDLIVESEGLTYIDSSGVACLVLAYKSLTAGGSKLRLHKPSTALIHVLQTLKFDSLFMIE